MARTICAYCERVAVVSGKRKLSGGWAGPPLCNAHQMRFRRGMALDAPMSRRASAPRNAVQKLTEAALALAEAEEEREYRNAMNRLQRAARLYRVPDDRSAA